MSGTFQGRVAFASIGYNAGVPSFRVQSGDFGATITDGGTGDIGLVLATPIDPAEACISLTVRGSAGAAHVATWTDTALRILVTDLAGVAADIDCDLIITVKPAN
jgi:hypothetical protein